jgi:hypothetical protein
MLNNRHSFLHQNLLYGIIISYALLSTNIANSTPKETQICEKVKELLKQRRSLMLTGKTMENFEIEYRPIGGGDDLYTSIDINGDKIDDRMLRSCGSSANSTCTLYIGLSNGEKLEFEESRFFLARINSALYVVVGESPSKSELALLGKRRIYQITQQSIDLICPKL